MKTSNMIFYILILIISVVKSENFPHGSTCQDFDGSEGVCVSIDKCKILRDKLRKGIIQKNQTMICNEEMRFVCCRRSNPIITYESQHYKQPSSWNLIEVKNFISLCSLHESYLGFPNENLNFVFKFSSGFPQNGHHQCGKPVIGYGTTFYGTQIRRGAYPWLTALIETRSNKFFCGGSLVSKNYVVSAAHCIEGKQKYHIFEPKDIFVILGGHNLEARNEPGRTTASVKDIKVHHDWNPYVVSYDADIAVIELADTINFNEYIQPICIAAPKSEAAIKTEGLVIGFGRSEHKKVENIARSISSPIYSHQFCANSSNHENLLTHRTFCGGYANGTNVCEGDSGSGLIVKHNGIYYLRGIVSASLYDLYNGCNINAYSVFTDILEFYSWVTSGKDDKIMLQITLDENKKLKSNITSFIKAVKNQEILIQELKEEIIRLKAHTTTTDSPRPNIAKGSACKNKDGLEGICDDLDNCKSLNGSIVNQISVCNAEMNYVCCNLCTLGDQCILSSGEEGIYKDINTCRHVHSEIQTCGHTGNMSIVCCPESNKKFKDVLCENREPDNNTLSLSKGIVSEFPFFASIGYKDERNPDSIVFLCGGTLISDDAVISVAHCFKGRVKPVVVKLGFTNDLSLTNGNDEDDSDSEIVEIHSVNLHPEYSLRTKHNDIAFIKLKHPFNSTKYPYISPICLSSDDSYIPENFTFTGFGIDSTSRKRFEKVQKVPVKEYPFDECAKKLLIYRSNLTEGQICGTSDHDICQGSSGGPLSYEKPFENGKLTFLYGISSSGFECGTRLPNIYTRVSKYLDWIEALMD